MIVHMIGNAHLDPVWLWPWQGGADEALATFHHAIARCEETPEFIYTRGEAWLFDWVERLDPALFERAAALVRNGRWQIVGGQWVQPDCNLPTLPGWNAQLEIGARYFQDKFGIKPRVGYNVDSFGHPATLPDILSAHGMESYVFHRPGPHQVELPAQTFRWRGAGGNEVIGFRIAQAYVTRTDELYGQIMLTLDAADSSLEHTMCFYGVGNHGGGPTKGNIEYILNNRDFAPGVELRFSHPQAFFDAIAPHRERLPVVEKELQNTFPGCYSVMADIKRAQHRGELELENVGALLQTFAPDDAAKRERLRAAWPDLAFTQFHDILAGTSIDAAWPSVRAMQGRAHLAGEELALETTRQWARAHLPPVNSQQIALFNANASEWSGAVEHEPFLDFDPWGERWLSDENGKAIPFQSIQPAANIMLANRVLFETKIAPQSAKIVLVRDDARPDGAIPSDLTVSPQRLSNDHVALELGARGVSSIELNGQSLGAWNLQTRADASDTWSFVIDRFDGEVTEQLGDLTWQVEEAGPLRVRVRAEGVLGLSRVRWTLSLRRDCPEIEWQIEVGWNERYTLLQMAFELGQAPHLRRDGLAGGSVVRPLDPREWPLQKWGTVQTQKGALGLLTPDIYSVSCDENRWTWTMLRSPRMAWGGGDPHVWGGRETFCDQGFHRFEGVLKLNQTMPDAADLDGAARDFVCKPTAFDRYEGLDRPPWGNNPITELWTGAEQRARRDGQMTHLVDDGARDLLAAPDGELPAEIEEVL